MVVLPRVGLTFMKSLGVIRGLIIKFLPSSLRLLIIGCLTPKPQNGRNTSSPNKKLFCAKYGKGRLGECLV